MSGSERLRSGFESSGVGRPSWIEQGGRIDVKAIIAVSKGVPELALGDSGARAADDEERLCECGWLQRRRLGKEVEQVPGRNQGGG